MIGFVILMLPAGVVSVALVTQWALYTRRVREARRGDVEAVRALGDQMIADAARAQGPGR